MFKTKKHILFFFLFLASTAEVCAQSSSQATMEVSARVIYSGSVEVNNVRSSHAISHSQFRVGSLQFKGEASQQKLVNVSNRISLTGPNGEVMDWDVIREEEGRPSPDNSLKLQPNYKKGLAEGLYAGEISTTVEYL